MKFVTLSSFRSGSSVFQRMLDSRDDVMARQEDLRSQDKWGVKKTQKFLEELYKKEGKTHEAVGFKLMYTQIRPWTIQWLKDRGVKFIQLIRRDLLETALWMPQNHEGPSEGGLGVGVNVQEGKRVRANIEETIRYISSLRRDIEKYRGIADFTIYYEDDLCGGHDISQFWNINKRKELLDWMGLEDGPLLVPRKKNKKAQRPPTEECVENHGELLAELVRRNVNPFYEDLVC